VSKRTPLNQCGRDILFIQRSGDQNVRATLLISALVLALPALASAGQIAVGLDWRHHVFVQEFWQEGKVRYAVYNGRPGAVKLAVNAVQFVNRAGTESFQAVEGPDLAAWEVKGKEVLVVDAPAAPGAGGLWFFRFRIADGPRLGLLTVPAAPADRAGGKVVSCDGLNGSGGRRPNTCFEQDALTFKSGGVIEVRLKLPAGGDTVTFKKGKGADGPAEALITEAACATLPIQAGEKEVVIDTARPLKAAAAHVVTLRFRAPAVEAPTLVVIDGWVSIPPAVPGATAGGYHLIRGVIVRPE
jgi:hypothetical protein